jgi:hypothetical protein
MGWNRKSRFGAARGRWLLAGHGAPDELVPALWVLPRPLGAPPVLAWMILSALAVSALSSPPLGERIASRTAWHVRPRRRPFDADGLATELLTRSGERVALTQPIPVPAEAR